MINSEIWDNVVSWVTWSTILREISGEFLFQNSFTTSDTILGSDNIMINSKIWNKVVSWCGNITSSLSEISMHLLLQGFLRLRDRLSSINNISADSKIWNWIVGCEICRFKNWLSDWNLPWNRVWCWSVLEKDSRNFIRKKSTDGKGFCIHIYNILI